MIDSSCGTNLSPEGAQPSSFEHLPPCQELSERLLPDMHLELQLAEWQRAPRVDVRLDEGSEGLELPSFNINLEDVDMVVT